MNKHTAALLEQHFDTAFNAPDGLKKLRELILTLAMQGKLVAQDPSDPPASALLKEIEAEKKRLVKEGKIKAPKPLPPVTEEEKPYALPHGWEWTRLGVLAIVNGGFAFKSSKYSDDGVRVIRISDFDENGFKDDKIVRHPYSNDLIGFSLEPNNILMAMTGGTVGKSLLVKKIPELMVVNQRVATIKIFEKVAPEFINALIRTNLIQSVIHAAKNSTNDNISMADITGFLVPLPSLPEQHRIVAKIDELMARCDALEKLRTAQNEKRLRVHAAAIGQLLNFAEPAQHQRAQAFLADHFGDLYTVKENVSELRKAILQLAVMGKLVPQNPNDPPASALLKEIEAEKKRLVKAGKIKAPKPLPPVTEEEKPYGLPQGWEWVRLGEIGIWKSGSTPSRTNSSYYGGEIPWVKSGEVKQGRIKHTEETITALALNQCSLSLNPKGAVLVAMYGANIGEVGILDIEATTNQAVCACTTFTAFDERYLLNLIVSLKPYFISQGAGAAQPNISREKIIATPFPLPPLKEQHRIVVKIDELMALCDSLDQKIDSATAKQNEMLDALMAQV